MIDLVGWISLCARSTGVEGGAHLESKGQGVGLEFDRFFPCLSFFLSFLAWIKDRLGSKAKTVEHSMLCSAMVVMRK